MSTQSKSTSIPTSSKIRDVQEHWMTIGALRGCANCENCDTDKSICKLYNAQPPVNVVTYGCEKWLLAIPF